MNLDDELRRAFRHKTAPPGLADKVLARIEGDTPGRLKPAPTTEDVGTSLASPACPPQLQGRRNLREGSVVRWLAAAAAITLIAAGGARYYLYQQTVAEAERVQADIRVALQITGEKLAQVQRKVQDSQQ